MHSQYKALRAVLVDTSLPLYLFSQHYKGNGFVVQAFNAAVPNKSGELKKLRKHISAAFDPLTMT